MTIDKIMIFAGTANNHDFHDFVIFILSIVSVSVELRYPSECGLKTVFCGVYLSVH